MSGLDSFVRKPLHSLDRLGEQLAFYIKALAWSGRSVRRYRREIVRLLAEVTLGTGALAVIGDMSASSPSSPSSPAPKSACRGTPR